MSDSEDETRIPEDPKIEETLRAIVARLYTSGDHSELTVKRVRKAAEVELDLPDDYLKDNATWKSKSKNIIADEHGKQENVEPVSSPEKPVKPSKSAPKPKAVSKPKESVEPAKRGTKRATPETKAKAQKKRKVTPASEDEDEESALSSPVPEASGDELSEEEVRTKKAPPKSRAKKIAKSSEARATRKPQPKATKVVDSDEEDEDFSGPKPTKRVSTKVVDLDQENEASPQPERKQEADRDVEMEEPSAPVEASMKEDSESEMSVLIDEEPPPKKKRQKKDSSSSSSKPAKSKAVPKAKAPAKAKPELSPQEAQIKELQANLVKCGVRKMWHNELKNCDTAKEKIAHLKGMLKDAGMDGRFSESKAKEIKERRELEKDIESAKDFASKFGAQEDKGRRRMGNKDWGIDESLLGGGEESDSD
ncbi:transcriptional regulator [Venturia nashicola]|uniref:Transcriptional regulator n=1 Tax=Venturia nashicola TaxID=86259 RepID=A0A4Z1PJQ7_9PEZI|nr:transcriptional regulator [Venturia nashicola]TLD35397.1 transcriptional regulator [Venturia nashicola]